MPGSSPEEQELSCVTHQTGDRTSLSVDDRAWLPGHQPKGKQNTLRRRRRNCSLLTRERTEKKTLQSEPSDLKLVNEEAIQGLTTFI